MKYGYLVVLSAVLLAAGIGYRVGKEKADSADAAIATAPAKAPAESVQKPRKLRYYRNPMGLADTSPVPKKDSMGMDYIAVYEGEDEAGAPGEVSISTEKVQKLGVRTEAATLRELARPVRAAGRIEIDERRLHTVAPKFEGWVERLHVNVTGQTVGRGQPLFEVYSPELVSAQREYMVAARGVAALKDAPVETQNGMRQLAEASLARLRNWDISEEQIKALAAGGEAKRTLTFRSPAAGIVLEKKALAGMRFMPGEALYQIADISSVWVLADVFEHDIGLVRTGQKVKVAINAYPEKGFTGTVAYIYPTLKAETRTIQVRIEMPNPGGLLKPSMYAGVQLEVGARDKVLTVPLSAVIDSGAKQIVLVQKAAGRFEPREVKLGARSDEYVEVRGGVADGEVVVIAANFLIDAESNLKAALDGFGRQAGEAPPKVAAEGEAKTGAVLPKGAPGAQGTGHRAEGKLESIDAKAGTVSITHGPVASLKWPGMTMDFTLANSGLIGTLKPGATVEFTFVERKPGEWVIVKLEGAGASRSSAHSGH
jgi:RND family efflux transporter MFP subunit